VCKLQAATLERRERQARALAASAREREEREEREAQERREAEAAEPTEPAERIPPTDFVCPITTDVMLDPVIAADGHAYERTAIERWLTKKTTSPLTGEELQNSFLAPNIILRRQIAEWREAC